MAISSRQQGGSFVRKQCLIDDMITYDYFCREIHEEEAGEEGQTVRARKSWL